MKLSVFDLQIEGGSSTGINISCPAWASFSLKELKPSLCIAGSAMFPASCTVSGVDSGRLEIDYLFPGLYVLSMEMEAWENFGIKVHPSIRHAGAVGGAILNNVCLFGMGSHGHASFGSQPGAVRTMENQGSYKGIIRRLSEYSAEGTDVGKGEPNGAMASGHGTSDIVWVAYDQISKMGFLAGFLSSERWLGRVELESDQEGRILHWSIGFDGADTELPEEGGKIHLEDFVLMAGKDPWKLLEDYGDEIRRIHNPRIPQKPPISWCSWYPYRLGVTEERVMMNARIAAQRLKPLGLQIIEVDLGWEKGNLPCSFEENERFPHGLKWLSDELGKLGFDLGVWKAPYTISEFDPLIKEHPEYLIGDEGGAPVAYWTWFWEPHGKVFILDLTHPGALQWLREKMTSLARRGVKYLKTDFISCAYDPLAKNRHDKRIASGSAMEAARLGAKLIAEALPDSLLLSCGGPEMPGTGHWPLLYVCNDTGNTGYISHRSQQANLQSIACHLFKNNRLGIIQPSCLCVGGPGTIEDARLRASVAFLSGGQIDISDTLTTLPEDRWEILTSSLPPLGISARPIDLFDPIKTTTFDYEKMCKGEDSFTPATKEIPAGSVWKLHVSADWDEWDIVGVFCYSEGSSAEKPEITRYSIPFSRLEMPTTEKYWTYEFWSGQFLGSGFSKRINPGGYTHAGDYQDMTSSDDVGFFDVSFFGPCAKLLCLRKSRPHPWIVGTSFHQSCGKELSNVNWEPYTSVLSGELHRSCGENGFIAIAPSGMKPVAQFVNGRDALLRRGANGSLVLSIVIDKPTMKWSVHFSKGAGNE